MVIGWQVNLRRCAANRFSVPCSNKATVQIQSVTMFAEEVPAVELYSCEDHLHRELGPEAAVLHPSCAANSHGDVCSRPVRGRGNLICEYHTEFPLMSMRETIDWVPRIRLLADSDDDNY